jgi:hypothetical protein
MKKIFIPALAILLIACNKSDKTPTRTQLLTSGSWKMTDYGIDFNKNGILETLESAIRDCDKDDQFTFINGGSLRQSTGIIKCAPPEPDTHTGEWALLSSDTQLRLGIRIFPTENWDITELNAGKLSLKKFNGSFTELLLFVQ